MPRVTIRLSDRTYRALKEAAFRQNRSMGSIIEESLGLRDPDPTTLQGRLLPRCERNPG